MTNHKDIFEIMKSGEEVRQDHPQYGAFMDIVANTLKKNTALNNSDNVAQVRAILSEIIGAEIDASTGVFAPFYINFGKHTTIGKNVFINHACSFLDLGGITIEDDVLIGPRVNLVTENHPTDPSKRKSLLCQPIVIKRNAWIGAGVKMYQVTPL